MKSWNLLQAGEKVRLVQCPTEKLNFSADRAFSFQHGNSLYLLSRVPSGQRSAWFCRAHHNVETMWLKEYLTNSRNTRFLKSTGDRRLLILLERITDSTGLSLKNTGRDDKMLQYFWQACSPTRPFYDVALWKYSKKALRTSTPTIRARPIIRQGTSYRSPQLNSAG